MDCDIDEEGMVDDREVLGEVGLGDYLNTPGDLGKRDREFGSSGGYCDHDDEDEGMCQESEDGNGVEGRGVGGKKIFF